MTDIGIMRKYDKYGGRQASSERLCDHPNCSEPGEFRAPKGRDTRNWHWFCLDHVRAFNAGWNYFKGMGATDIHRVEASRHTWNRPTWRFGNGSEPGADFDLADPLDIFPDTPGFGAHFTASGRQGATGQRLTGEDIDALQTLGLEPDASMDDVKSSYRRLIRQLHPDSNGGDRSKESRLQAVINAYNHLRDKARRNPVDQDETVDRP